MRKLILRIFITAWFIQTPQCTFCSPLELMFGSTEEEFKKDLRITYVDCPDGTLSKIREGAPWAGSYIHCEDFDQFYELLNEYKDDEAEKYVLKTAEN